MNYPALKEGDFWHEKLKPCYIHNLTGAILARSLWFVELIKKTFPQRFLLARLTHVPILGRIIEFLLFEGDDIIYLPKDSVIQVNKTIPKSPDMALPSQVIHHFIDKANFLWRMDFCICRAGSKCEDYPINLGCLFLGEAVLGINPQLGRQISKEEAHKHIRRCQEAGLVHLVGRNKLDTVWLDIGPGNKLLTICNCCPCCCLWRIAPQLSPNISNKVTKMPGVNVKVDPEKCVACGTCVEECFVNAIHLIENQAIITKECRGCGRCVSVCPQGAIEISIAHSHYIEDSIKRIGPLVDVT
ncbi:MAG: DUF362 domain-containing protein [Candidatus Thorarchaeota archaeon]